MRRSMLRYYNECAAEYEETVLFGARSASIPDPNIFRSEGRTLAAVIERIVSGRVIDIACGTAFWLQHYAARCSHVTLFDQSEKMLVEAKRKVSEHGLDDRWLAIRGDFFEHDFPSAAYDCVFACFFLSHLTEDQEATLFARLRQMLDTSGRFLICDSAWSVERARYNGKIEHQQRCLNDGRASPFTSGIAINKTSRGGRANTVLGCRSSTSGRRSTRCRGRSSARRLLCDRAQRGCRLRSDTNPSPSVPRHAR